LEQAASKWDLRLNVSHIKDAIDVTSPGQEIFLAAMLSFYDGDTDGALLHRVGVRGLANPDGIDFL
jgi:hypothetical protein